MKQPIRYSVAAFSVALGLVTVVPVVNVHAATDPGAAARAQAEAARAQAQARVDAARAQAQTAREQALARAAAARARVEAAQVARQAAVEQQKAAIAQIVAARIAAGQALSVRGQDGTPGTPGGNGTNGSNGKDGQSVSQTRNVSVVNDNGTTIIRQGQAIATPGKPGAPGTPGNNGKAGTPGKAGNSSAVSMTTVNGKSHVTIKTTIDGVTSEKSYDFVGNNPGVNVVNGIVQVAGAEVASQEDLKSANMLSANELLTTLKEQKPDVAKRSDEAKAKACEARKDGVATRANSLNGNTELRLNFLNDFMNRVTKYQQAKGLASVDLTNALADAANAQVKAQNDFKVQKSSVPTVNCDDVAGSAESVASFKVAVKQTRSDLDTMQKALSQVMKHMQTAKILPAEGEQKN